MKELDTTSEALTNTALSLRLGQRFVAQPVEVGCLQDLFEAQVDATPNALALVCGGRSWTYAELDRSANRMARLLRFHDVGPGQLVGLYFDKGYLPILAILGVLKAGAGYVPIDPVHPKDRIQHILIESGATLLVTEHSLEELARDRFSGTILVADRLGTELTGQPDWRLTREETGCRPDDLCYVLYTSGTTGRPKGVMAEHANAVRYVHAFNEACRTSPLDRVYQGFSLGFDGSVEEIWMAFSNGSALVVGTKETPRFGNDLARFLTESSVSYFSTVPTLLSTMSEKIPTLRTLVVSGEACPPEIVDRWAGDGCRLYNVYGPTEATVNTTLAECFPGRPVTIGKPLKGYDLFVLDENFKPVPHGDKGELFVGGDTLARGYLKQPELTAKQFMEVLLPSGPRRLYRTGDLVRWNEDGDMEFFGRMDGQIKIRGYRVELSEIESVLREFPGIRSAVVRLVKGEEISQLAAYVVLAEGTKEIDSNEILARLKMRLPDYMIPAYLDVLPELPMLASGKVDRSKLPAPAAPLVRTDANIVEAASDLEAKVSEAWSKVLGLPKVSVEANFFTDLGGHSLLAAQVVTYLRKHFSVDAVIRDAYKHPTIRLFANNLQARAATPAPAVEAKVPSAREVFESVPVWERRCVAALQAVSIYAVYGLVTAPVAAALLLLLRAYQGTMTWASATLALAALGLALIPLNLLVGIGAKWVLIGRYKAGRYPLWSFFYFRWWLANRLTAFSGAGFFAGTPVMSLYYRLMGAKVGRGCLLDTAKVSAWDLVSIGDETSIGSDTQLLGYRVENGMLVLGSVEIGNRCFVGLHSALGLNVRMGDDSRLDDQSLLQDGAVIVAGEGRRGSPAQPFEVALASKSSGIPTWKQTLGLAIAQYVGGTLLALAMLPLGAGLLAAILFAAWKAGPGAGLAVAILTVPLATPLYCFYVAGLKRLLMKPAKPGVYPIYSFFYVRKWLADGLIRASRAALLPLYTTLYLPPFLRLLGAKIGKRAEMSTVWYFSPDMLDVSEESFFADGCILGGRRTFGGSFELAVNHVGRRSFVGNSAILPVGKGLGDNCLLGVLSAPPLDGSKTPDGTEWLGVPAFSLPNRPKPFRFDEGLTFKPKAKLYAQRAVVDALRILIPGYLGLASLLAGLAGMWTIYAKLGFLSLVLLMPALSLVLALANVLAVVLLKVAVMGEFKPVTKPLWSMYVWLNEMVNGAYESVMAPAISPLQGTPFVAPFLRLIGCKIGKHAYIESTLFSEFDLVEIGHYAALNLGSIIQTHLFEDRVMKSSYLKVGDECSVGNMAVVLYDTEMEKGSSLASLSLLMKGEKLGPGTRWHGIPTIQIGQA